MRKHTRWKRIYPQIIGKRYFDAGEYSLSLFTVLKAWKCKEFCKNATAPDNTHWFDKTMILVETDTGLRYKIPYCPWAKVVSTETGKYWSDDYNTRPF